MTGTEPRYLLVVLSHGQPESPTAEECLDSFVAFADPPPAHVLLFHDGPGFCYVPHEMASLSMQLRPTKGQLGFCEATRRLWRLASLRAAEMMLRHVFWLEHDFVFTRPVPIDAMADLLDDPKVAQVQLMRGHFPHEQPGIVPPEEREQADGAFLHSRYFTTNPSLLRTRFMRAHPWPDDPAECEGKFGIKLREAGYRYAVMGEGEPWVEHIGQLRTGRGY